MIDLTRGYTRECDGVTRREFIKVGSLPLLGGLTLPQLFRAESAGAAESGKAKSVILLNMIGGPSHQDIFDPKPENTQEYKGPFSVVPTNVPGIYLSEHMPLTARCMDKFALLRSVTHGRGDHEGGNRYMLSGWKPNPVLEYPNLGSAVAKAQGFRTALPPYIHLLETLHFDQTPAGYLPSEFNPFSVAGDPNNAGFSVQDINLPQGIAGDRYTRRKSLLGRVDDLFRSAESTDQLRSMDKFYQRAYGLISSAEAKAAFDLKKESDPVRDRYGRNMLGQGALLARRLVERGVRFVTISRGGWDTHHRNFEALSRDRLPELDRAVSGLLEDLATKGLLDETLVVWMGEFGRTPKVDYSSQWQGGRHHWPHVQTVMLAGGGIRGGQVYGSSDAQAAYPKDNPVKPEDIAATVFHCLGIDPDTEFITPLGRPTKLTEGGEVLRKLLA